MCQNVNSIWSLCHANLLIVLLGFVFVVLFVKNCRPFILDHLKCIVLGIIKTLELNTYCSRQRIDCAKESRLADGRDNPDGEREVEELHAAVDILQKPEKNVRRSGQESSVKEEVSRTDRVDVFPENGRENNRRYEH